MDSCSLGNLLHLRLSSILSNQSIRFPGVLQYLLGLLVRLPSISLNSSGGLLSRFRLFVT